MTEKQVSCIVTALGIFHPDGRVWLVSDGVPDWDRADVRCSQDEQAQVLANVQAGFQRRWDRLQMHYAEMKRLGARGRTANRGVDYD